jgi:hypothetical protein
MNDSQQRLISLVITTSITVLFIGLGILAALSGSSVMARLTGVVIAALICFAYLFFSPQRRSGIAAEIEGAQTDGAVEESERQTAEKKIKRWILREVAAIQKMRNQAAQKARADKSPERCHDLFPFDLNDDDVRKQLIAKLNSSDDSTYLLNDTELISLRYLPEVYRKGVLRRTKSGLKLNVLEFLADSLSNAGRRGISE